jgi:hypothetical protein
MNGMAIIIICQGGNKGRLYMKKLFILPVMLMFFILIGCSNSSKLESVNLAGLSGKEILVGLADESIVVDGYSVSVYEDELIVIIGDDKISVDLPDDEYYLSVAPYKQITHECYYHSATGCRGELKLEEFYVEFIDSNGNVVISKTMLSMANGFIDLWLPRNIEGTLTITQGTLEASKQISTYSGNATCETTMKLIEVDNS